MSWLRRVSSSALPCRWRSFAGLGRGFAGRRPVYLNSACLTPTPRSVAAAVAEYYSFAPACPLRSRSRRSNRLEDRIREARDLVRGWIGARFSDEIVFTANATASINILASSFAHQDGTVLITDAEHNSNRLPWLSQGVVELAWPPGSPFPFDEYEALLERHRIKLVSVVAVSNVTGASAPVRAVVKAAHDRGIPVHIDAAQQASHQTINISEDQPDFLSLSLHKAYGPCGLGILYVMRDAQHGLAPSMAGGGTVDDHYDGELIWAAGPARFEYGLQNYAAQYSVPSCIRFLQRFPAGDVADHFRRLNVQTRRLLEEFPSVRFIGPARPDDCGNLCNFYLEGRDSLRVAELLDLVGDIQVRAGKFCAHHFYHRYGLPPSIRVAFGYYNTEQEIAHFVQTLRHIIDYYLDS